MVWIALQRVCLFRLLYLHHTTPPDKKQVFFAQGHTFVNDIFPKYRVSLDKCFYLM